VTEIPPILRVGLTGGVASGKSTVAAMLSAHGALVVDADRLVHEITSPGRAEFDRVVSHFGVGILDDDPGTREFRHAFVGQAAEWHRITDDLPTFEGQPPRPDDP